MKPGTMGVLRDTLDQYGDSYARDVTVEDLWKVISRALLYINLGTQPVTHTKQITFCVDQLLDVDIKIEAKIKDANDIISAFRHSMSEIDPPPGWMFHNCVVYIDTLENAKRNRLLVGQNTEHDENTSLE